MIFTQRNSVLAFAFAFICGVILFVGLFTTRPEEIAKDLGSSIFIICTSLVLVLSFAIAIISFIAEIRNGEPFSWGLLFVRIFLGLFSVVYFLVTLPFVMRIIQELT